MLRFICRLQTVVSIIFILGLSSIAWADLDSDGDGMPDSFENQYLGEVMFEDHFDDGTLDSAWVMKRTYWEEADGKLKTVPKVLPGFNYGHGGNGRGSFIVLHEGDPTWTDYSYEFTCSSLGVVAEHNPYGLPIGYRAGPGTGFRVQEYPASWNEPANYRYKFGIRVADANKNVDVGDWGFGGDDGTYIPGNGWNPNFEGTKYTFSEGNSPAINPDSQPNHVNVLVKENKMYAWVNGVFIGDAVDQFNISPYGGISLDAGGWESMAWYDDVIVRSVGLNPDVPDAHLDYDNDGFTNLEEYQNGTNPLVPESNNCKHAIYSFTRRTLTIPFIEIPVVNFLTGQPTGEIELWAGKLKQVFGTINRFRLMPRTINKISDGSSSSCMASFDIEAGILSFPYVDIPVPVGIGTGNEKPETHVDVFKATMTWTWGGQFIVKEIEQLDD